MRLYAFAFICVGGIMSQAVAAYPGRNQQRLVARQAAGTTDGGGTPPTATSDTGQQTTTAQSLPSTTTDSPRPTTTAAATSSALTTTNAASSSATSTMSLRIPTLTQSVLYSTTTGTDGQTWLPQGSRSSNPLGLSDTSIIAISVCAAAFFLGIVGVYIFRRWSKAVGQQPRRTEFGYGFANSGGSGGAAGTIGFRGRQEPMYRHHQGVDGGVGGAPAVVSGPSVVPAAAELKPDGLDVQAAGSGPAQIVPMRQPPPNVFVTPHGARRI